MVVEDNRVHIMWLLPQYAVVTVGEILFSITSMEFAYSQAPPSMKSVLQVSVTSQLSPGNSFICPTRSGTTEIYIFGPAGAGIQNKICNIHLIDIVLQVQKYIEVQVFLLLQKYLEYQKLWNCSKLSERDTDMQNNIVKLRQRVRQ